MQQIVTLTESELCVYDYFSMLLICVYTIFNHFLNDLSEAARSAGTELGIRLIGLVDIFVPYHHNISYVRHSCCGHKSGSL